MSAARRTHRRRGAGRWGRLAATALLAGAALGGVSTAAHAQSAPQLHLRADDGVGVGDVVQLQLSATSAEAMPDDAKPGPTPGFVVRGQNEAPSQTHIVINGSQMDRYTLTTTWALEAQHLGTFRVGPASVSVNGMRYRSAPVTIHVVPAGHARRARPAFPQLPPGFQDPFGMSPFDMWKGLLPGLDNAPAPEPEPSQTVDPKLALDAPRGSVFFLHATVDKAAAVVGEQVTFSVYQYTDVRAHGEISDDVHEATAADFVKHPLLREDQTPPLVGYASIAGRIWEVRLLRRWALFPLRPGSLAIGPMRLVLARGGAAPDEPRLSETLLVRATEPPIAGRPPGYAVGDVGDYSLEARVSPRQIDQGGALAVHVEVSGTGNVPSALTPPVREGVQWLTPETHDELGPLDSDRNAFGGKRTFDFVVRVDRAGVVDLGEMRLPYWDPAAKRYDVARAPLGSVRVAPSTTTDARADAPPQLLPNLPPPRAALEGSAQARAHLDDSPFFWLFGVAAWPVAFGAAVAGRSVGRRARNSWRRRRESPAAGLRDRVAAAHAACGSNDARAADAAIARALEAAAVAHVGVSVQGALTDEVTARLRRAGVEADTAAGVAGLLRECETARFAPEGADIVAARDRWVRAQGAIRSMERSG